MKKSRILAVSSGGGHWEQLMIISESFKGCEVHYATTLPGLAEKSGVANKSLVRDCNRHRPFASLLSAWDTIVLVARVRPHFVVSTGAAPGFFALLFGKFVGAKGIWIDSVANADRLSICGRLSHYVADLHLTQWRHLSYEGGPTYMGSVL